MVKISVAVRVDNPLFAVARKVAMYSVLGNKLLKIASPVTLRLELVSRCRLPDNKAYRHLDARTYELTVGSVEEALFFNW